MAFIIPQQETSGNYNSSEVPGADGSYYTTTRDFRELQHASYLKGGCADYTTTRDFRELQQPEFIGFSMENYTTTIDFSELQFVSERKAPQGKRLHGL